MNNLIIKFYHPSLDTLSDRTFRFLLKKISSLCRDLQTNEVLHLINSSSLAQRGKQSLRDRIQTAIKHNPAYYVERIEKGSLEITVCLTLFGIWLLQTSIGETIKEAWKTSDLHKWLLKYLTSDNRKNELESTFDFLIGRWDIDRFKVENINKLINDNNDIEIIVFLNSSEELEIIAKDKIDSDYVIRKLRETLSQIDEEYK